jgi:hypothetical protein
VACSRARIQRRAVLRLLVLRAYEERASYCSPRASLRRVRAHPPAVCARIPCRVRQPKPGQPLNPRNRAVSRGRNLVASSATRRHAPSREGPGGGPGGGGVGTRTLTSAT